MQEHQQDTQQSLEQAVRRVEQAVYHVHPRYRWDWKKRLCMEFFSGIVRGIGFSIGFTLLGALMIYALRNIALANLPVIGKFVADLVRIVELYL